MTSSPTEKGAVDAADLAEMARRAEVHHAVWLDRNATVERGARRRGEALVARVTVPAAALSAAMDELMERRRVHGPLAKPTPEPLPGQLVLL